MIMNHHYLFLSHPSFHLLSARPVLNRIYDSVYEIKGQKLYDLLNERSELSALEDQFGKLQLVGLTQHACMDLEEFLEASDAGRSMRSTAATGANATSSRSHCAMLVRVYQGAELLGKLSLIDLAGSERGVDNENTDKTTRKEGRDINTSLLALKEVIRALQHGHHAQFRQSKLTQVLEESLSGENCHTTVIACVSGAEKDCQHTMNTLRYASDLRPGKHKAKTTSTVGLKSGWIERGGHGEFQQQCLRPPRRGDDPNVTEIGQGAYFAEQPE